MSKFALLAALGTASLLAACGGSGGGDQPNPETLAKLAALPAPYNTADLANGQSKFAQCRSCHTIAPDGADMTGPALHGVFGRVAGTKPGYNYSDALKAAGFTWEPQHLDHWIANPRTALPGTKMTFAGLEDPKDRKDLIAYLMIETAE
jgi:cytochrome c